MNAAAETPWNMFDDSFLDFDLGVENLYIIDPATTTASWEPFSYAESGPGDGVGQDLFNDLPATYPPLAGPNCAVNSQKRLGNTWNDADWLLDAIDVFTNDQEDA